MGDRVDRIGQRVGDYRLLRWLGGGGFGDVYLGEHIHERTQAAVKILQARLTRREELLEFINEARTIRLKHPHIVSLLDFGIGKDDTPFLVMTYAPHGTLRDRHPKGSRLPLSTIVSYVRQLSSALQYAHSLHLVHRDVKPENMLVGASQEVLLSDFGIAAVAQSSRSLTTEQGIGGTLPYMAPEQIAGKPRAASDQYALGIVIYEWITGRRPFTGTAAEIAMQHTTTPPPSLREQLPTLPVDVEQVVLTALAKDPKSRFTDIEAFARAFEQASQQVETSTSTAERSSGVMFGFDAQHTHTNPYEKILNPTTVAGLTQKWVFQAGGAVYSSPAVADGAVYIGSYDHQIYALDAASGTQKWAFRTAASVGSSPAVVDGVVCIGSYDSTVYALDATSGTLKWAFRTGDYVLSSPAVVGGVVYIGSWDGKMYALDAASGIKKWTFQTGNAVRSSPAVAGSAVYVGSDDHNVYALDAAFGTQKWAFRTGDVIESSSAVVGGVVYIGCEDGNVYALDAASGTQKWAFHTDNWIDSSPVVASGLVYVGSGDGTVYALDAASGTPKWAFRTGDYVLSSPAVVGGVVYVGSDDGHVYAFHLPGT